MKDPALVAGCLNSPVVGHFQSFVPQRWIPSPSAATFYFSALAAKSSSVAIAARFDVAATISVEIVEDSFVAMLGRS